jgi:hypothetical protein
MKRNLLFVIVLSNVLFYSCKKNTSPVSTVTAKCKPASEYTNLSGNAATYEYTYGTDGNIASLKKYIGGGYHVLADSLLVYYDHTIRVTPGTTTGSFNKVNTVFNANIFTGSPTRADISITLDGVEQRNYYTYSFSYDTKNRLVKIGEQTNTVINDLEYDLFIIYNDQNNVSELRYEATTGPRTVTVIAATGYDNKRTPFSGIINWPMLMHAGWASSDSEPLFTALSKNNPLGFEIPGWKRTITYAYNNNGFPVTRFNTNTTNSGTYSFEENFNYQCN